MSPETVRALGRQPPPKLKIHNILAANREIARLESELAAKNTAPAVRAVAAPAPRAVAPQISTAALEFAVRELPGLTSPPPGLSEPNRRKALAALLWRERLTYPGCESDFAAFAPKPERRISDATFKGENRAAIAAAQGLLNGLLRTFRNPHQ
jgi:hypothetical protein